MSVEAKITTFENADGELILPWAAAQGELRVWSLVDAVESELFAPDDWTYGTDRITIASEHQGSAITIACVPCPELSFPKFGTIQNDVLQDAWNDLMTRQAYYEVLTSRMFRAPVCKTDGTLICRDGQIVIEPDPAKLPGKLVTHCKMTLYRIRDLLQFACLDFRIKCTGKATFCPPVVFTKLYHERPAYVLGEPCTLTAESLKCITIPKIKRWLCADGELSFEYFTNCIELPTARIKVYG